MTQEETKEERPDDWKSIAMSLVTSAIQQSSSGIIQAVHEKIEDAKRSAAQGLTILFMVLLGGAFLLVGGAQLLGEVLGHSGYGYVVVGASLLLLGVFVHAMRK